MQEEIRCRTQEASCVPERVGIYETDSVGARKG